MAVFHGGLSRLEKEAAIARFRGPARLLLCTEAGSEGRNLQFAHAVCNFDLPWNPMKIEQRIGRLSRIGQTHDVHVFNLVAAGTVEAAVLHLLEAKLSMFELVIGEIDMILGNLDDEREFQDVVADLWAESADGDDFARRMDALGDRLLEAKRAYLRQRSHDDRLFGDRFTPEGLSGAAVHRSDDRQRCAGRAASPLEAFLRDYADVVGGALGRGRAAGLRPDAAAAGESDRRDRTWCGSPSTRRRSRSIPGRSWPASARRWSTACWPTRRARPPRRAVPGRPEPRAAGPGRAGRPGR